MDYIKKNKAFWDDRTGYHVKSEFYDQDSFLKGRSSLNPIELDLLGDVRGKSILHLQCHFGQDSMSLARMGAQVTGVDLSDKAIEYARNFAEELDLDVDFVCCNVYDLPKHLNREFDIVFTSYGTIVWLPDLTQWADLIGNYLKPGGRFVMAEFHPFMWMFDDDFKGIKYPYDSKEPIIETTSESYASEGQGKVVEEVTWNHSLSSVMQNLLDQGLLLDRFQEYEYSPYNCVAHMEGVGENRWIVKPLGSNFPLVYGLVYRKDQ